MKLINLLQKDDRLMIKNIAISSALHIFLVVITALTFPFIAKKPIDLPPLISIELIQITDKTNIPFAPKAKKIIEKVKEKEKVVEPIKSVEKPKEIIDENSFAKGTPSPAASKILSEKNITASSLIGSGRGGRITKDDALKALPKVDLNNIVKDRKIESKKLSMLRRKVAQRLVAVKNQTAMLTTFNEVNMTQIFNLRKKYKEEFKEKHGVGLGFMSLFTTATDQALQEKVDLK